MWTPEGYPGRFDRTDLSLDRVTQARQWIDPVFLDTPQYEDPLLSKELGRSVTVKIESANPLRSFKARGVSYALRNAQAGTTLVCASSGNFGQAVAYVARSKGVTVRVHTPRNVNPTKRMRMEASGAQILAEHPDLATARAAAAADAQADSSARLILDGVDPALAEGAATIAEELTQLGGFDSVVVPVGDGSLISGIGLWFRTYAPRTRVIGVVSASAPAIQASFVTGVVTTIEPTSAFAEGISIATPHEQSLTRVRALVDEIVAVDDEMLAQAILTAARHLSVLPEPAGAAGIAAIMAGRAVGSRVATVITGANLNPSTARLLGVTGTAVGEDA